MHRVSLKDLDDALAQVNSTKKFDLATFTLVNKLISWYKGGNTSLKYNDLFLCSIIILKIIIKNSDNSDKLIW